MKIIWDSNLFNKDDYNTKGNEYGLSDFLNGDNAKKIFMMHRTSRFIVNNRINRMEAYKLYLFGMLLKNKPNAKLPNPLPIFIDQDELNNKVVELYNREGVLKYHEIINKLLQEHSYDLTNYYLINWSKRAGLTINDEICFKSSTYLVNNFSIIDPFRNEKVLSMENIKNIFQLN